MDKQPAAATPSQLDLIAEANDLVAGSARRRFTSALVVSLVALILLAVFWWVIEHGIRAVPTPAPAATTHPPARPQVPPAARPAPAPPVAAEREAPPMPPWTLASAPEVTVAAQPPSPSASSRERAQAARARREAEARALQQQQQERKRAEEQESQRREAEAARVRAEEEQRRLAAEQAAAAARLAAEPARSVQESCAGRSNIVGELLCRSRECRNPQRANDPTCVRQREIEEARQRTAQP